MRETEKPSVASSYAKESGAYIAGYRKDSDISMKRASILESPSSLLIEKQSSKIYTKQPSILKNNGESIVRSQKPPIAPPHNDYQQTISEIKQRDEALMQ